VWTTDYGVKVRVKDMTDQHLLNAHRFMRREVRDWGNLMLMPMADDFFAWASGSNVEHEADEWIAAFAGEIRRRHLTELEVK